MILKICPKKHSFHPYHHILRSKFVSSCFNFENTAKLLNIVKYELFTPEEFMTGY